MNNVNETRIIPSVDGVDSYSLDVIQYVVLFESEGRQRTVTST